MDSPAAFHLLAKPTGPICNLDCQYCYLLSIEALYPGDRFRMSDGMLETISANCSEHQHAVSHRPSMPPRPTSYSGKPRSD